MTESLWIFHPYLAYFLYLTGNPKVTNFKLPYCNYFFFFFSYLKLCDTFQYKSPLYFYSPPTPSGSNNNLTYLKKRITALSCYSLELMDYASCLRSGGGTPAQPRHSGSIFLQCRRGEATPNGCLLPECT